MKEKVTIYDIAETAGVSPASVSRMIHQPDIVTEKTKAKIMEAFRIHGIGPEDLSIRKKSAAPSKGQTAAAANVVLVCIPSWDNPFYDDILKGISDYLSTIRYHMVVTSEFNGNSNALVFLNYCASLRIKGIISLLPLPSDTLVRIKAVYPIVQCSEYNPLCREVPYVSVDDHAAAVEAMEYLVRKGCTKIGFFCASRSFRYVQNRFRAYETVMQAHDLTIYPEHVVSVADFSYTRILRAASHFFKISNPPDAIFAVSDKHAHAVIKAASAEGFRVPEDVKVFGFDNSMYASLSTPTISTIDQPQREIGLASAKQLMTYIQNPSAPVRSLLLKTRLIIQDST